MICDVLEHLVQGLGFDLLALELGARIVEVEQDMALMKFLDKKLRAFAGRCF